jgi:diaminohydroxyphosphoribosylaminopyrimidine deaminase / 5-amino-6-(5-phosphoribosylamino)uracil reductase
VRNARPDDDDDTRFMRLALALGERGRCSAPPNPWVGCVLVRDGRVVGQGYHRRAGEPHAESWALAAAGARARGATAYVTLEPCAHVGRTPPCVDGLIAAGVARVVVGVLDPDPRVAGRGLDILRRAAIETIVGVCSSEAAASLAPYLHQRRTGRAYCVLKAAISLDGRTAAADGSARWITGPLARADVHVLRNQSQAVVVGAGTALADLPALTVRDVEVPPERQPLRVLLDGRGRVAPRGPLFDLQLGPTLVITTADADPATHDAWLASGADVEVVPAAPGVGVDLAAALLALGRRGVLQALVEGGPTAAGAFLRGGLVDRVVLYVGARTLGEAGRPLFAGPGPTTMAEAGCWRLLGAQQMGDDTRLEYAPLIAVAEEALV